MTAPTRRQLFGILAGAVAAPAVGVPVASALPDEVNRVRVWPALNYLCASYAPDGPNILIAGYTLPRHYEIADIMADDKPLLEIDGATWRIDRRPGNLSELRITMPDNFGPAPVVSAIVLSTDRPAGQLAADITGHFAAGGAA